VLLLVDHPAKAGTGSTDAGRIHPIDEEYARRDFEKRGRTAPAGTKQRTLSGRIVQNAGSGSVATA